MRRWRRRKSGRERASARKTSEKNKSMPLKSVFGWWLVAVIEFVSPKEWSSKSKRKK